MDRPLTLREFNNKGRFWHSSLIDKSLIYYLFPFLSMERSHVKKCAEADLQMKGHPVTDSILNRVADELLYCPEDLKVFSLSDCDKISSKVDYVME